MALKITAMSLTAVQVRAGYPSVQESMAAGSGQGRHSFYFYRHIDSFHWVGFQVPSCSFFVTLSCTYHCLFYATAVLLSPSLSLSIFVPALLEKLTIVSEELL